MPRHIMVSLRLPIGALAVPLLALAHPAVAADRLVETVDLSDKGLSTEGGEAKLFRLENTRLGTCKIEVVHLGEMGRTTHRFLFDRQLSLAAIREYAYNGHIASTPNVRQTLRREINLSTPGAAAELREAYAEARGFFVPARLAQCDRPARR